jgi:hypothetical protein
VFIAGLKIAATDVHPSLANCRKQAFTLRTNVVSVMAIFRQPSRLMVGCLAMKRLLWLALLGCLGSLFGQSAHKAAPEPKFSELTHEDRERLDRQRAVVAAVAKQLYGTALTRTKKDLPILQRLLDDKAFEKSQTYELQSLGVVFGDVLASEFSLRWVMMTDEFGTDPTLRFKNTSVTINALTMISKRVERDEHVSVLWLLRKTREGLSDAQKWAR